jgi:hypothetical protein
MNRGVVGRVQDSVVKYKVAQDVALALVILINLVVLFPPDVEIGLRSQVWQILDNCFGILFDVERVFGEERDVSHPGAIRPFPSHPTNLLSSEGPGDPVISHPRSLSIRAYLFAKLVAHLLWVQPGA